MSITDSIYRKYSAKLKKYDKSVLTDKLKKILFDEAVNETAIMNGITEQSIAKMSQNETILQRC